jgi:hypothetical protein
VSSSTAVLGKLSAIPTVADSTAVACHTPKFQILKCD